ncbi:acyl-CoA dehydrogenase family protein [Cumulibacter soli]|uniref:acyl-CoA dehydrogenase family protein n=1 Tax=Cumulibacter soli TaxID=2546344 RepID=UPI0010680C02|nr:acyl-CoA dehydrogenase family protein [Cumulibacter soli]
MDLTYSEEQQALRDGLARYLDRSYAFEQRQELLRSGAPYSTGAWQQFVQMGLTALPFAENVGGIGGTIADVVAVGEILGEYLSIEPFVSAILCGRVLEAGGAAATELLTGVVDGSAQVALAHEEGRGTASTSLVATSASKTETGYRLHGRKEVVIGAAQASHLIVTARISGATGDADGVAALLVRTASDGVTVREYRMLDGRAAATVSLDNAEAEALVLDSADAIDALFADGIITLAAEAVGAMNALLRITIEYGATRQQFGVPIGTFQVLAHRMADMKMAYLNARSTLLYTTALAEAGRAGAGDIAVLKAQVGRLGRVIGESAVQLHGGIGTTDELSVGHYLKRILTVETLFGDSDYHLRRIGATAGIGI